MRGWITVANGTCGRELPPHDPLELVESTVEVVVDDLVAELRLEGELPLGDTQALLDLTLALRRPRAKPLLELLLVRRRDEDRHRVGNAVADGEGSPGLD